MNQWSELPELPESESVPPLLFMRRSVESEAARCLEFQEACDEVCGEAAYKVDA